MERRLWFVHTNRRFPGHRNIYPVHIPFPVNTLAPEDLFERHPEIVARRVSYSMFRAILGEEVVYIETLAVKKGQPKLQKCEIVLPLDLQR